MASNSPVHSEYSDSEDPIQEEINESHRLVQRIKDQIQADTKEQQEVRKHYSSLSEDLTTPEMERQEKRIVLERNLTNSPHQLAIAMLN